MVMLFIQVLRSENALSIPASGIGLILFAFSCKVARYKSRFLCGSMKFHKTFILEFSVL